MFIPLPFYSPMDALPGLELNSLIEYLFKFFLCLPGLFFGLSLGTKFVNFILAITFSF